MEFTFRLAGYEDVDQLDELMQMVNQNILDKAIFSPDNKESIERHIEKEGRMIAAFCQDKLAALFMVRYPKDANDNLGESMGFGKEDMDLVAHMESVAVNPLYRGYGLQQTLMAMGAEIAAKDGYIHSMATVSPDNPWSLNNALAQGYIIVETKPKYGGFMRHIIYKKLK